jgi:hypothetical protein
MSAAELAAEAAEADDRLLKSLTAAHGAAMEALTNVPNLKASAVDDLGAYTGDLTGIVRRLAVLEEDLRQAIERRGR